MATATTERPTESRAGNGHYRAYTPRPFTRAERESVTILFGGLHWRVERVLQAVLESAGHRAQVLPVATRDDLLTGREVADIGQCCPTSFTTGNLVNFLKKEAKATSAADVNEKFVYLTAGSCGACRFGQYHQSYELALRNSGLDAFRMFLLAQDQLDQKAAMGDGLDLNLPVTLGCLWAIFCTDLVQDLEYQVRPYEVVSGQTEAVVKESVELLYQAFRNRPRRGPWRSVLWFLTTGYFVRIMKRIRTNFASIEVDRLRVKPTVKITGEFYLQTVEGDPNYNIHRWLESRAPIDDPLTFTIIDRASGEARGLTSLMRIDAANGVIEIGHIWLSPALQRTRQATEAIFLLSRYVFDELGYRRYEWKCDALNEPSRRAAERFGFVYEGIFRQHMVVKGRNRDTAWYSMLDSEWPSRREAFEKWLSADNFDSAGHQLRSLASLRE